MTIEHTVNRFADLIGEVLYCDVKEEEAYFIFTSRRHKKPITLQKEKLREEVALLQNYQVTEGKAISTEKVYEVLIREERISTYRLSRYEDNVFFQINDNENKLSYSLGVPSNQFLLYLLKTVNEFGKVKDLTRLHPFSRIKDLPVEELCVFDLIRKIIPIRMTLKLVAEVNKKVIDFENFTSAFLYNISYNTDQALIQQNNFEELLRSNRISKNRKSNINEDFECPKRIYINELVYHYQLAVSTENPVLEYISYYHIVEYFFDQIFHEDLIKRIKDELTHPNFSYKKDKDILSLIKNIRNLVKLRDDNMTFSEEDSLRLTLKKYLNIEELVNELNDYDETLVAYYMAEKVKFSEAPTVDLEKNDRDEILKKLTSRIYKNRNSIVHSKENEKSKYIPFKDDKFLSKEVPLLRFIAEQVIFNTSKLM